MTPKYTYLDTQLKLSGWILNKVTGLKKVLSQVESIDTVGFRTLQSNSKGKIIKLCQSQGLSPLCISCWV